MAGVRQFNEDKAFEKALALFWEKGFEQTTMQELAAVTGVQRGSLYNAYQGKETFFLRVFDVYRERFLEQIRLSLDKPVLRDALSHFFDYIIDSMMTGTPTRGCLSTKIALGGDVIDEPIRMALQGMLNGLEAILAARFTHAEKEAGLMIAPEQAARLVVTFTRGLVVIERVYQDKARLRATADMLLALLFGVAARSRAGRA
jgi:AcrR family transcriptional regulator